MCSMSHFVNVELTIIKDIYTIDIKLCDYAMTISGSVKIGELFINGYKTVIYSFHRQSYLYISLRTAKKIFPKESEKFILTKELDGYNYLPRKHRVPKPVLTVNGAINELELRFKNSKSIKRETK